MNSLLERTLWTRRANRIQRRFGAVGGRLTLTDQRVVFEPNAIERHFGGEAWETECVDVRDVAIENHDWRKSLTNGLGLTRYLKVVGPDGKEQRFVLHGMDDVAHDLLDALPAPEES